MALTGADVWKAMAAWTTTLGWDGAASFTAPTDEVDRANSERPNNPDSILMKYLPSSLKQGQESWARRQAKAVSV